MNIFEAENFLKNMVESYSCYGLEKTRAKFQECLTQFQLMKKTLNKYSYLIEQDLIKEKILNNRKCKKCGITIEEKINKYCGDGTDKDNSHRWEN